MKMLSSLVLALALVVFAGCREDEVSCPDGQTACNEACYTLTTDINNCGDCGVVCGTNERCVDGTCICKQGFTDCNGNCVSTMTDDNNCGSCGTVCPEGTSCSEGFCQ